MSAERVTGMSRAEREALHPFHLDHCDAQDPRRECSCGLARILASRTTEDA